MRTRIAVIVLAAFALAGCASTTPASNPPPSTEEAPVGAITGEWQLTKGSDAEGAMVVNGVPVTLVIADDAVNGQGPCNGYGGDVELDGTGIRIGALTSTKMACADESRTRLETRYLAALEAVTSSELGSGDPATLTLSGPDATLQFTGVAKKSPNGKSPN